ncbi:Integrase [Theobroma cacao]|nr:Integrase [Theobroma cacao]
MICYECNKLGHFKSECPLLKDETLKKNKRSKKAMVAAAWSNSDTSSSETDDEKSEEIANICLMAQEDETKVELDLKETCLRAQLKKKQSWYLDSGCSRHMIGYEMLFAQLDKRKGGTVSFGDDSKGRIHGISTVDLDVNSEVYLVANAENDSWLWHKRLGHVSMHTMSKLIKKNLIAGLPKLKFEKDRICDACQLGKQVRTSFKTKKIVSTSRPLELLHIDLFGPIITTSLGGKSYDLVIVDDYSKYTWLYFLAHKNDALQAFLSYYKKVENEKGLAIVSITSDHGREFENDEFEKFCNEKGLDHNFSAPRTPQQNGVVERKNLTLKEMAMTILCENNLPKYLWVEVVNTAAYILNRVSIRPLISKTPYELYKGRKPKISHLRSFGSKCFVLNNRKQPLRKFDAKSDEAIFLGYALNSKAYRVFNKRTLTVEESVHVVFDESNALQKEVHDDDDDI